MGYWKLDEGQGFHAKDSSGRGNGLTLTQPALWTVGHWSNTEDSIFFVVFFLYAFVGCGMNDVMPLRTWVTLFIFTFLNPDFISPIFAIDDRVIILVISRYSKLTRIQMFVTVKMHIHVFPRSFRAMYSPSMYRIFIKNINFGVAHFRSAQRPRCCRQIKTCLTLPPFCTKTGHGLLVRQRNQLASSLSLYALSQFSERYPVIPKYVSILLCENVCLDGLEKTSEEFGFGT